MYIINRYTIEIVTIINPYLFWINQLGEVTNITNIQYFWNNCINPEAWFEQAELPNCDPKYYKVVNNEVVEMNEAEKQAVDKVINDNLEFDILNWIHRDRRIRITLASILTYTDEQYIRWATRMQNLKVPFEVFESPDPYEDKTEAYLKFLYKDEGFYIENNQIKHPDTRMKFEYVGQLTENQYIIFVV